jgi:hypothetical protein
VEAFVTDVCVPISRLAECIIETQNDLAESFLRAGILGHAGDGNFHVGFYLLPNDPKEMTEAQRLNERLVHLSNYGKIRSNLLKHVQGFPTLDYLSGLVKAGQPAYGMAAVGTDKLTPGAQLLMQRSGGSSRWGIAISAPRARRKKWERQFVQTQSGASQAS